MNIEKKRTTVQVKYVVVVQQMRSCIDRDKNKKKESTVEL